MYNWQFVHAIDFWSLVISASCEKETVLKNGESPLGQLMYPLIQVALATPYLAVQTRTTVDRCEAVVEEARYESGVVGG